MSEERKILLSLPQTVVDQLDEAAKVFSMCRLDVIRRSLARDLDFVLNHEIPKLRRWNEEIASDYSGWVTGSLRRL